MFISELFEAVERQILVIYPGRFQPPHKGHAQVFQHLCQKYGTENVFIVTSDKVDPPKSPFNFKDKQFMWFAAGVDPKKVRFDVQPYQAKSLVDKYDSTNTILLFAISEKDMAEDPRFQFKPKKDGSPSYFQPLKNLKECKTFDQHGYITTVPTFNFTVLGKPANSATQIRELFTKSNEDTQMKIVTDLFGKFNPAVFELMQEKLVGQVAEDLETTQRARDYGEFCKQHNCPEFISWEYQYDDEYPPVQCESCKKIGQSHSIVEYPENCNFLDEIKNYRETN